MKKHRVGLIGGFRSVAEARAALPPSCELVGLCDIKADVIEACRREAPNVFCATDYREIAALQNCDTVATFTPNNTHRDIAVACLRGGKNVWIEKPMGINLEQGRDILRAEQESGRRVGVDLEVRFSRMTGPEAKKILDSGELGRIVQVEADHHRGGWTCDTPQGDYRVKRATSGMMKMDGIHHVDLFRHWNGEVAAVQSFAAPNALPQYEFPDNLTAILWFANGALGRITTSHTKVAYSLGHDFERSPSLGHICRWAIVGTRGALTMDAWRRVINVYHFEAKPDGTNSLKPELDRQIDLSSLDPAVAAHDMLGYRNDFLERMAGGRPPYQTAADAFRSEVVAQACDQSAYEGGRKIECSHPSTK